MPSKKKILIADDSSVNRKILVKLLSSDYFILEAENGQMGLELLNRYGSSISCVILDLAMPVMDGFSFLKTVHKMKEYQNIPIVVATGSNRDDSEARVLRLGAWDFISKPYDGEIIKFRVGNAIKRSQLSTFDLVEFDMLTGIYKKSKFFQATRKMLDSNLDKSFVLVRLDIDRFQLINSFFGTEEGDRLLIYLAKCVGSHHAGTEYVYGRIEADVFAMCFTYATREDVLQELECAKERVKSYNHSFDIVPIFGVYFLENLLLPVSEMLDRAALAAKTCKGNYINTTAVYVPELSQRLEREQEIINEMVVALEQKQFCIYLQPKYMLETNSPAGAEALVRWQHPVKGMISPNVFIPVFEKNGFISKLDYYVWESICALLQAWLREGYHPAPISVNVSRANLYNPNTAQIIADLVSAYAVPPELLQLELTESAYMDNPQMMEQFVGQLHEKGFTILMDDFGSNYSSLSILKDIEVDVLKIDMRFFENTKVPGRGENIIASVIRMAKWLKMSTIAEGVEKEEQVNFLHSVGCDYVQGYYFARPMTVEAYKRLITENSAMIGTSVPASGDGFNVDRLWCSDPEIEMLFSNAAQANCIYEFDGRNIEALRVNKAFNKLFGYNREANCLEPLNIITPAHRAVVVEAFQSCVDGKEIKECTYCTSDVNGKMRWINLKLQYICKVGVKYILMGHLTDITIQKRMEFKYNIFIKAVLKGHNSPKKMLIVNDEVARDTAH